MAGRLHLVFGAVYALGSPSIPTEGRLVAALIHSGPGAVLSHRTALWWWGLVNEPPARIEVSTVSRARSLPEVLVHHPRHLQPTRHRRFPTTTLPRTLRDFAAKAPLNDVRQALAQADYLGLLEVEKVGAILGRGCPGTATLRVALDRHQPRLAHTRSRTERIFARRWEETGRPMPEVNVKVHGWRVDFLWRTCGLVVETDGYGNHHTTAQIDRDRRMDLTLRSHGLTVNRYSRRQVEEDTEAVIADVIRTLEALGEPTPPAQSA